MDEKNKNFRKKIRALGIHDEAKRELYNLLKYVDLTVEREFSVKNYHVVVNDYAEVYIESVVDMIEEIFSSKVENARVYIKEESCFSSSFCSAEDIYIVKMARENFSNDNRKIQRFFLENRPQLR